MLDYNLRSTKNKMMNAPGDKLNWAYEVLYPTGVLSIHYARTK